LRGTCETYDTEVYIDDLPGINLVNLEDTVDGLRTTASELFTKVVNLAERQVTHDFSSRIRQDFNIKSILSDHSIRLSGNDTTYGGVDEFLSIKIKRNGFDKFQGIRTFNLGINVDRVVADKKFYVVTSNKDSYTPQTFNLVKGYNKVAIDIHSAAEEVKIYFDVCNMKVGKRSASSSHNCGNCISTCACYDYSKYGLSVTCEIGTQEEEGGAITWVDTTAFGFDLDIQRYASKELIACYFAHDLLMPMLYKSGITFLLEMSSTSRINDYTTNNKSQVQDLLLRWNGGQDFSTGINHKSEYWRYLTSSIDSLKYTIHDMHDTEIFINQGTRVSNSLP